MLLIAEDPRWAALLAGYLPEHGFSVTIAAPGDAWPALTGGRYAAVLLELPLMGPASLALLEQLRAESPVPVLALTESATLAEHLRTLDLGATGYLARDATPHELLAELRRVIRVGGPAVAGHRVLQVRGLLLDLDARRVMLGTEEVVLAPADFALVAALAAEPGRLFSRDQLAAVLNVKPAAVDTHVASVRRKLGHEWILTVRGCGYLLPLAALRASNSR